MHVNQHSDKFHTVILNLSDIYIYTVECNTLKSIVQECKTKKRTFITARY